MWVIGETKTGAPPSVAWVDNFVKEKNVTFPVMRDFKFLQTYGAIQPHSNALPHQYILDGDTMELVFASGGVDMVSYDVLSELLGETVTPD